MTMKKRKLKNKESSNSEGSEKGMTMSPTAKKASSKTGQNLMNVVVVGESKGLTRGAAEVLEEVN